MEIKSVEKYNINDLVEVHKDSFSGFFLTQLGDEFLKVYYDSIRKDRNALLVGFFEEGVLSGFYAACLISKGFNENLVKQNILKFLILGIRLMFTKPTSLIRLIKNLSKSDPNINDKGDYAELLSIGVSQKKQGKGIGKELLIQLEKELKQKGCTEISLTTDFDNNDNAIGFYKRLGYSVFYEFIAYPNRKMYRMIKKIN
jgi:ribosomal protein S18 acetylase RimI-like enzyme